ncbi:MAG: hypothetical protein C0506_00300 [Anaerolinea sp.]|nr:hypothetical protein [Anaerolinea sp.]
MTGNSCGGPTLRQTAKTMSKTVITPTPGILVGRPIGPQVICVRGPSRSGKTSLCERLVAGLGQSGLRVAYLKRTHHLLDLPGKSSARLWDTGPALMVLRATDRLQVTHGPGEGTAAELLQQVPHDIDVVLFETHAPEPYPAILSEDAEPVEGELVIGSWSLDGIDAAAAQHLATIASLVPRDRALDRTLRIALAFHGGHACPGMVLGARLAVTAGRALELALPDRRKRLFVVSETDRCGADAIQTVTGCRPGKRTMKFLDYGKLAARFLDAETGRAIRVSTRSGLRDIARDRFPGPDRHASQMRAYLDLPAEELFTISPVQWSLGLYEQPGPPVRRVECADCGEEVSDGREVPAARGLLCQACAGPDTARGGTTAQREV